MPLIRVKAATLSLDTASLAWSLLGMPLLRQKTAGVFALLLSMSRQRQAFLPFFTFFGSDHLHKLFYSLIPDVKTAIEYKKAPEKPTVEKNTLYGYACWHYGADGDYYVDPYGDITVPGSWQDTIKEAETTKRNTNRDWLLPHMFNHDKNSLVGAVVKLKEDARGVYYETKLANTPRAREVKSLASDGLLGASYGYNPLVVQHVYHENSKKMVRKLVKVSVAEISAVVLPANPYATAGIKSLTPMLQASGYDAATMQRLCNKIDDQGFGPKHCLHI